MLGYLSADVIREANCALRGTDHVQIEALVFIILQFFFETRVVFVGYSLVLTGEYLIT